MKGIINLGRTKIFEIDNWTNVGFVHTFTGKLTVYARKLSKNTINRSFRVIHSNGDESAPLLLKGTLLKCTHSELQIKVNEQR
jgi:hypothetical protein